ncbi:SRPBCC family protein [Agaribacter marinus]|uniref:Ubiquinone-binding protein n=1 Tax=Agaribacter marinus TaxID=1431249 RepID=A0AA37SXX7_9ALTE|nr:SRPBCC family protein [Agaribacter marinus]GLR70239.1 ubiquinone-binding protein [Agaribacter marinus]
MPKINKNALVAYSAKQMFSLVNDVDAYDQFLPGCKRSTVLNIAENQMTARMVLSKAGIEKELVTQNTLVDGREINMQLAEGPFKSLNGGWTFTPLSESACKVELSLEFTFKNKLVEMAFGKIFTSLTNNMVKAFTERAKQVYN